MNPKIYPAERPTQAQTHSISRRRKRLARLSAALAVVLCAACAAGGAQTAVEEADGIESNANTTQGLGEGDDPNTATAVEGAVEEGNTTVVDPPTITQPETVCPLGQQPNGFTGGPSTCCSGKYQVCDDFEGDKTGGSPNAKFWEVELLSRGYGRQPNEVTNPNDIDRAVVMEISEARSARGKKSLHIVAQNSNLLPGRGWHHDMLVNRTIFPAPNNTFWGRAFVYYVKDASNDYPNGHCTLADASGKVHGSKDFYTWWRVSTYGNFLINCERGDGSASTPVRMPTNRWACLEWHYQGDASNTITLFMDGNQLVATNKTTSTSDNPAGLAPVYDAFRIGWENYNYQYNPTPKQFEMYYDEIALDFNRIGCDR